jgi:LPS export ABC transporter permease LptG
MCSRRRLAISCVRCVEAISPRSFGNTRRPALSADTAVRIIDRYILKELVVPFALGVALFTFFLLIDRIYHLADLVVARGIPFRLVLRLLVLMLPSFLTHTLSMALLVAVLLAGGRLAGDLEIIAFKAAGVSVLRLFRPVLFAAIGIALLTTWFTLAVNPRANDRFKEQLFRMLQSHAMSGLQPRVFNDTFGDVIIYVEEISASQLALRGVLVSDERDPQLSRIITAREGRVLMEEGNHRVTLRLINGAVNEADVLPSDPATPPAGTKAARRSGAVSPDRYRYTNFSLYDMSLSLTSPLARNARVDKPEKDLGHGALLQRIRELAGDRHGRVPYEVELHKRFALPVAALVFALVAFPLAVRSHRVGRAVALAGSLGILLGYYLLMTSLEGAALRLAIPAWAAMWAPNALFLLVGLIMVTATVYEWQPPRVGWAWHALAAGVRFVSSRVRRAGVEQAGAGHADSTHILDRYLIHEFVVLFGIGLTVAATLFVMVDLLQTLDRYLRVKPSLIYILEHFVFRLPAALYDGLPVVMLVATVFLFLTLNRFHELTAMKAAGISLYRISTPILLLGLSVAVSALLFQELFLPRLRELGEEVDRVKIRGELPRPLQSRERMWLRSSDTRFFRIELMSPQTSDLFGVTVLEVDTSFRLRDRFDARQAHWTPDGWEISDGAYREPRPDGSVDTTPFTLTSIDLSEDIGDFTKFQKRGEDMSYWELREYITKLQAAGFQVKGYLVDLYSKLSFPLVNLVMVLVGIPFSLQSPRNGRVFGVGLAIAIMAGYLVVHYVALSFARADLLPPLIAAWAANVIFFGIGTSLFLRART